jgi:lipopolysaccharide transport system permease protein
VSALETRANTETLPVTVIRPSRGWAGLDLREMWRYRELTFFLIWRDVKVRYKQTLLGAGWAVLKPFLSMVIFSVIFGRLAGLSSDGFPYPVFSFAALLPWTLFHDGVAKAGTSLVSGSNLITKVYFPRLSIPLAEVIAGLVDFALAFLVLLGMMAYYGIRPTAAMWALPFFILLTLVTSLGVGLWLSALHVTYRDVGYVTPFILQAWQYASPVVYSTNLVPQGTWRLLYGLNPLVGVIQGFRWAMLGSGQPPLDMLLLSVGVALVILVSGIFYFRRMERTFADVV